MALALTLAQARSMVADHLDDRNNVRWSTTRIDPALQMAISACISEVASGGYTGFDQSLSTTSTSAGLITLSTIPMLLRDELLIDAGSYFYPVVPQRFQEKVIHDTSARNVKLKFVPEFILSSTTSDPLIGSGATAAATWPAFDRWVCAVAALQLGVGDKDRRDGLVMLEQMARKSVMERLDTPTWRPLPQPRNETRWGFWSSLCYVYQPSATAPTIQLCRDSTAW